SQTNCEAKVCDWNGGKTPCPPPGGCSALAVCAGSAIVSSSAALRLEREQQQQRDQQREDAERLGDGEAEDQVAELSLRRGRIAQSGGQVVAENDADADAGAPHADAGDARTDVFRCHWIHNQLLLVLALSDRA